MTTAGRSLRRTRRELSDFLVRHRGRLTPADVGLPARGRRRTPGLRREEVAALAGVGLTWYTWFEQGRDIQVSGKFLLGVAHALRLDDAQCSHLFLLAHGRPPPPEAYQQVSVSPLVQRLMDELARPAYAFNLRWDVVAWNTAADALFGFGARDAGSRNLLRLVFADPALRQRLPAWREDALRLLAQFRYDFAVAPEDALMQSLVRDLKALSPVFRHAWEASADGEARRGVSAVLTADGARLDFQHETLLVDEHRHLRMTVYFAGHPGRARG